MPANKSIDRIICWKPSIPTCGLNGSKHEFKEKWVYEEKVSSYKKWLQIIYNSYITYNSYI